MMRLYCGLGTGGDQGGRSAPWRALLQSAQKFRRTIAGVKSLSTSPLKSAYRKRANRKPPGHFPVTPLSVHNPGSAANFRVADDTLGAASRSRPRLRLDARDSSTNNLV